MNLTQSSLCSPIAQHSSFSASLLAAHNVVLQPRAHTHCGYKLTNGLAAVQGFSISTSFRHPWVFPVRSVTGSCLGRPHCTHWTNRQEVEWHREAQRLGGESFPCRRCRLPQTRPTIRATLEKSAEIVLFARLLCSVALEKTPNESHGHRRRRRRRQRLGFCSLPHRLESRWRLGHASDRAPPLEVLPPSQ